MSHLLAPSLDSGWLEMRGTRSLNQSSFHCITSRERSLKVNPHWKALVNNANDRELVWDVEDVYSFPNLRSQAFLPLIKTLDSNQFWNLLDTRMAQVRERRTTNSQQFEEGEVALESNAMEVDANLSSSALAPLKSSTKAEPSKVGEKDLKRKLYEADDNKDAKRRRLDRDIPIATISANPTITPFPSAPSLAHSNLIPPSSNNLNPLSSNRLPPPPSTKATTKLTEPPPPGRVQSSDPKRQLPRSIDFKEAEAYQTMKPSLPPPPASQSNKKPISASTSVRLPSHSPSSSKPAPSPNLAAFYTNAPKPPSLPASKSNPRPVAPPPRKRGDLDDLLAKIDNEREKNRK
jgi:hypothetical protein